MFRTLSLQTEPTNIYHVLSSLSLGDHIDIDNNLFKTFSLSNQNQVLAKALALDVVKYRHLFNKRKHCISLNLYLNTSIDVHPLYKYLNKNFLLYLSNSSFRKGNINEAFQILQEYVQKSTKYTFKKRSFLSPDYNADYSYYKKYPKDNTPWVSVIMSAKNEEKCLSTAIISLLNQTWSNIELIFIDDGSTDDTSKIFDKYAGLFPRVQYIKTEGVGVWSSRNMAMEKATGELITFHDADDWSHPLKIELQANVILKCSLVKTTCSGQVRIFDDLSELCLKSGLMPQSMNASSFMFENKKVREIGYFFDDLLGSDMEFIHRVKLLFGRKSFKHIRKPLSIGYAREEGLSIKHRGLGGRRIDDWEKWNKLHLMKGISNKVGLPAGESFSTFLKNKKIVCNDLKIKM